MPPERLFLQSVRSDDRNPPGSPEAMESAFSSPMLHSPIMKITSITDLEFPRLKFSIRQGEVKDLPADPEAAAFILASVYIREVPEPQSETKRQDT